MRQDADISELIWDVPEIISILSQSIALRRGDIIMTGTPAGVSPVKPGDTLHAYVQGVGEGDIRIAPAYS